MDGENDRTAHEGGGAVDVGQALTEEVLFVWNPDGRRLLICGSRRKIMKIRSDHMPVIRPFKCVRPAKDKVSAIAALPYDVYDRKEAKAVVEANPLSFLKIDRGETQFPDDTDMYSSQVYERARDTLKEMIEDGLFVTEEEDCYFLYALTRDGRTQTGIVGCASVDDYLEGRIRRHENTKEDKEQDRICHVDALNAQTGPIFLAYRRQEELDRIVEEVQKEVPLYDFTSEDGVRHQVFKIEARLEAAGKIGEIFARIGCVYIADGHHRAASAVKVGLKRRRERPDYDGTEEFNYFLSVLFPAEDLKIFDYNRVVTDSGSLGTGKLMDEIRKYFYIEERDTMFRPGRKGEMGMYRNGKWYCLTARQELYTGDPVDDLDVSILQNKILEPVFKIQNPKADPRLRFVGGIRGLEELARLADESGEIRVAFAMYPTSMEELLAVADSGRLMPPKSTWFEPKLRSGLFIHLL